MNGGDCPLVAGVGDVTASVAFTSMRAKKWLSSSANETLACKIL